MSVDSSTFLGVDIPPVDTAGLKTFGLMFAAIIATLFGVLVPLVFTHTLTWWPWVVAVVFVLLSLLSPDSLSGFYNLWMRFGVIMNMIMSRIILGGVFLVAVIPTAIIMKLKGNDMLGLKHDKGLQSYRKKSDSLDPEHMKKPY
jgi:predicted membrane protein